MEHTVITRKDYREAMRRYEGKPGGADAVYEFARERNIKTWSLCTSCDAETPTVQVQGSPQIECLVCGTVKSS